MYTDFEGTRCTSEVNESHGSHRARSALCYTILKALPQERWTMSFHLGCRICGHIVMTVYSVYALFCNTHLLSMYRMDLRQGTVTHTDIGTTEWERFCQSQFHTIWTELLAPMHCIHVFVSFTLLFKMNLNILLKSAMRVVLTFHTHTPHYHRNGFPFIASHTEKEPELKTTKGRDSAVMYISNRAYLSTT